MIIDIGVLHGEDSLRWLQDGHDVVSVEPIITARLSQAHADWIPAEPLRHRSDEKKPHWTIVEAALVPEDFKDETIPISVNVNRPELSSCTREWGESREVATIKLSKLFLTHGIPDLLKMDIEGFEYPILRTVKELSPRDVVIELSHAGILDELARLGYKKFRLSDQNKRAEWPARYRDPDGCGPTGDDWDEPWVGLEEARVQVDQMISGKAGNYWCDLHGRKPVSARPARSWPWNQTRTSGRRYSSTWTDLGTMIG